MGDVPLAYVETTGGVRVAEDDVVVSGKNDVCFSVSSLPPTDVFRYSHSRLEDLEIKLHDRIS